MSRGTKNFLRKFLHSALAFSLLGVFMVAAFTFEASTAPESQALKATGGSGKYRDEIEWITWGTARGQSISNGAVRDTNFKVGNDNVTIRCTLSNLTGSSLRTYIPGSWGGDGLDDLYNLGGTGSSNQMVIGIQPTINGGTATFNVNCISLLNGVQNDSLISGLVFAEGEASNTTTAQTEYVRATTPSSTPWRILEDYRACTNRNSTGLLTNGGQTLELSATQECSSPQGGPVSVAYAGDTTSLTNVTVKGGGLGAIALGVFVATDFGDAPASYGVAGAVVRPDFTGGEISTVGTKVNTSTMPKAEQQYTDSSSLPHLGNIVDNEATPLTSPDALGDDTTDLDDEDIQIPRTVVRTGSSLTLGPIKCVGAAGGSKTRAWMDFNNNGVFDDNEASQIANCAAGATTASYVWTNIPAGTMPSGGILNTFARFRIAQTDAEVSSPLGMSGYGEVEDHPIRIEHEPKIMVTKNFSSRYSASDQVTARVLRPDSSVAASTTTSGTALGSSSAWSDVNRNTTYRITESMAAGSSSPLSYYNTLLACYDRANGNAPVPVTGTSPANWAVSNLQPGQSVECVLTNSPKSQSLELTKSATDNGRITGPDASGNYTVTYQVQVKNAGDVPATYGDLVDRPQFSPNLQVLSSQWTSSGTGAAPSGQATGGGPYTLAPAGTSVGVGQTHTYTITTTFRYSNQSEATTCGGPGSGLYNSVTLPQQGGLSANACVQPPATPGLQLQKTAALQDGNGNNAADVGETIRYTFRVTNTGNTTLSGFTVNDPKVGTVTCSGADLAPGDSRDCTVATYVVTQNDVDAGSVDNTATATANSSRGGTVTSNVAEATVPTASNNSISVQKSAAPYNDANNNGRPDAGETIQYSFVVTNTGPQTVQNPTISDSKVPNVTCPQGRLAPKASVTCTGTYTLTQADIEAGSVTNQASSTVQDLSGVNVTATSNTVTTSLARDPKIALTKSVQQVNDVNSNGRRDAGDTIDYTFRVSNTGNVRINSFTITDAMVGAITCEATSIEPNASVLCRASHTITQAEVNAGTANNSATVEGTTVAGNVTAGPATTATPITRVTEFNMVKSASEPIDSNDTAGIQAGDTVRYTFTINNTGSVTLSNLRISDPKVQNVTCPAQVAPGNSVNCTATYTLTQADIDAGKVVNTATAYGTPPGGQEQPSQPSTATVTIPTTSSLGLQKTAGTPQDANQNNRVDAGDTIAYTFTVTNTGNTTISNVAINDPKVGAVNCPATTVAPTQSVNCTATYTITQADVNAGAVKNTATAGGTSPSGTQVTSGPSSTSTDTSTEDKLTLDKTASAPADTNNSRRVDAGDTITYTFAVKNDGARTVDVLTINDPKVGAVTCPENQRTIQPGQTATCTATYTITQADVDAGTVDNVATATADNPGGTDVSSNEDRTSTAIDPTGGLTLTKSAGDVQDANTNQKVDAGDTIAYTFVVKNESNVTLREVSVSDPKIGTVSCPATSLAPGADMTCTATYQLTQTDLNNGNVVNNARATGTRPDGTTSTATATNTKSIETTSSLSVDKQAGDIQDTNDSQSVNAGDTIPYTFTVTNTGTTTLTSISISDPKVPNVTCTPTTLNPGEKSTCTGSYQLTQDDLDGTGTIENTATASGNPPSGPAVESDPSTETVTIQPVDRLTIDKSSAEPVDANESGSLNAGDTIAYTFTVTNTGTTTLTGLVINDTKVPGIQCPTEPLAPGATATCTGTYTITQADMDAGVTVNTATATATPPQGRDAITSPADNDERQLAGADSLSLTKAAGEPEDSNNSGAIDAGSRVPYTFTVKNTGTRTLTDLTIDDPKIADVSCQATTLAPGAETTCEGVYILSQDDIDAGEVVNTATASANNPSDQNVDSNEATDTLELERVTSASLDKKLVSVNDANGDGKTNVDDTISYEFLVKNTGNTTISNVVINDSKVAASCPSEPLLPGRTAVCNGTYTITQDDMDAGTVDNTATATVTGPAGVTADTNEDTVTTELTQSGSLGLDKSASAVQDTNGETGINPGDTINYTFVVTNLGTVTVNSIAITDPLVGAVNCGGDSVSIAPGESVTCTATYALTQGDIDAGTVDNRAEATGTYGPDATKVTSNPDTTTTTVEQTNALTLEKVAGTPVNKNENQKIDAGDEIPYTFTVRNTGTTTINNVAVNDPKLGSVACAQTTLAPGASMECTGTYDITQADVDAGDIVNVAQAEGTGPGGATVESNESSATVTPSNSPSLLLDKNVVAVIDQAGNGVIDPGDTIEYEFLVTNNGTVRVDGLTFEDPKVQNVTCKAGETTLYPGQTVRCTATYSITQADIDAGTVENTATATATSSLGGDTTSNPDSTETEIPAATELILTKQGALASTDTPVEGSTVNYTFLVNNSSNVTINNLVINDPLLTNVTCDTRTLAPGAGTTCRGTYSLTQDDLNRGEVVNTATASGTQPDGSAVESLDATATVSLEQNPDLSINKRSGDFSDANGDNRTNAGDTLAYEFDITNTGNVSISLIDVLDEKVGNVVCDVEELDPNESTTCRATYTLTQADIDNGSITNSATAIGSPPQGEFIESDPSEITTEIPLGENPDSMTIVKKGSAPADTNNSQRIDAGDTITYTFTLTNTGVRTLSDVGVSDPKVADITCEATTLAPNTSTTCTGTYTLSQDDVNAAKVDNTATSVGTPPGGSSTQYGSDDETVTFNPPSSLTIDKSASAPSGTRVGATIDYTFVVTNTGATTLSGIAVEDSLVAVTCREQVLLPGAATTCSGTYTLTQDDIDAGTVNNYATATGNDGRGEVETDTGDSTSTPVAAEPSLTLDKTASEYNDANTNGRPDKGELITYTFEVVNTGNVTMNGIVINDDNLEQVSCDKTTLAPNEVANCQATYAITQDDIDAGTVDNTATATGNPPSGDPVTSNEDTATSPLDAEPGITIEKSAAEPVDANNSGTQNEGDTIEYTFVVTNTGNTTLNSITVTDTKISGEVGCPVRTLAPGESTTCKATYTITQDDMNAGEVKNTASVNSEDPDGESVGDTSNEVTTPLDQEPQFTLDKSASGPNEATNNNRVDAGDTVDYTFTVVNTGNVTLTEITINDPLVAGLVTCDRTTLEPGQTATCTATYTLKQGDVDAGTIDNEATATATLPNGSTQDSAPDETSTPLDREPALDLVKTASEPTLGDNNRVDEGDTIDYTFTVTNTGNTTLTNVKVTDQLFPSGFTCEVASLDPGKTLECTATYTLTQPDIDRGSVTNNARADATDSDGNPQTDSDSVTTELPASPDYTFEKTAGEPNLGDNNRVDVGDTIDYTFTIVNTGNVTLNELGITDPKVGAVTCTTTSADPGATLTCTATYVITQADIDAGQVDNTATASMRPPLGDAIEREDSADTVVLEREPGMSLDKQSSGVNDTNGTERDDAGDTIDYTFTVTNTGNTSLTLIGISDPLISGDIQCPTTSLAPGQSTTCNATYTLTPEDMDKSEIINTATVSAVDPSGDPVGPISSNEVKTPLTAEPGISIEKSGNAPSDTNNTKRTDEGDTIDYTFVVTNTGNTILRDIKVTDAKINGPVSCGLDTLEPGQSTECVATYTITQPDMDAGNVTNTAEVSGQSTQGGEATNSSNEVVVPLDSDDRITIFKSAGDYNDANGNGRADEGETIRYTFEVNNLGNRTLSNIRINDPLIGDNYECDTTTIAPGGKAICTATYEITQANINNGAVRNTATATGTLPGDPGEEITSTGSSTNTQLDRVVSATVDKTSGEPNDVAAPAGTSANDTIEYTFTIENTGNVTLTDISIDDAKVQGVQCESTTLEPGEKTTCTAIYTLTQDDIDNGKVTNTASLVTTPGGQTDPVTLPGDTDERDLKPVSGIEMVKTGAQPADVNNNNRPDKGEVITYTFSVKNTGVTTLEGLRIEDPKVTDVTCEATTLGVGESTECAGTYTLQQADIDRGYVDNTATAIANPKPGGEVRATDEERVTLDSVAGSISLVKTATYNDANESGRRDAGDTISYLFTVQNTGNLTVTDVSVDDPMLSNAGVEVTCRAGEVAPGDSVTCQATYTITQSDVNEGTVDNTATASGTLPGDRGTVDSNEADATVDMQPAATLDFSKSVSAIADNNGNGQTDAGDVIGYSFTVTNSGTVSISGVQVVDPMLSDVVCQDTTLEPGESTTCAGSYTISQADVDKGEDIVNTAYAVGTTTNFGGVRSNDDSTETPLDLIDAFIFDKSASDVIDANESGRMDVGDTITFSFTFQNTGTTTLRNLTVNDSLLDDITCPVRELAPTEFTTCTGTYTITLPDMNAGTVDNIATGTVTAPDGSEVASPEDETTTPLVQEASLTIEKSVGEPQDANGSSRIDAGDTVEYTFVVTNIANVTVSEIGVDDPLLDDVTCDASSLDPNESTTCRGTYTIQQSDVNAGYIDNTATAFGETPKGTEVGSLPDSAHVDLERITSVTLNKTSAEPEDANNSGRLDAGDTITYTFVVKNTGNTSVTGVRIEDSNIPTGITCEATELEPNAETTCTGTYTITQADMNRGFVENSANAVVVPPGGGDPVRGGDDDRRELPNTSGLSIVKNGEVPQDANGNGRVDENDTIAYTFVVTNTGTTTLTGITVNDPKVGAVTCPVTTLEPGQATTCTATYVITQDDMDAGEVENTATVSGTAPNGEDVTSDPSTDTVVLEASEDLVIEKSASEPEDANNNGRVDEGEVITYTFRVTNNGTTTLRNIAVNDQLVPEVTCEATTLRPGASTTCTGTYAVTQADIDAGQVYNDAYANGTNPSGNEVRSLPDDNTVEIAGENTINIEKSAADPEDANNNGRVDAGDTITYSFVIENRGNTWLRNIVVTDPKVGPVDCPSNGLAPGTSMTCYAVYTISQDDVDAGEIVNTASVNSTSPQGENVTDDSGITTPIPGTGTLSIDKSAAAPVDANESGRLDEGDTIDYSFVVTNTGTQTITGITVNDPKIGAVDCPDTVLVPGENVTCTGTYTITQDDIEAGQVVNEATATGKNPRGENVDSEPDTATVPVVGSGDIEIAKSGTAPADANDNGRVDAGEIITYTFTVTNTGTRILNGITVNDPKISDITCEATTLRPGASTTCTGEYAVTQAEIDAQKVDNVATATGNPSGEPPVTSLPGGESIELPAADGISVDKSASAPQDTNSSGRVDAGDTIYYTFTVTNTGNTTLANIRINDPKVRGLACPVQVLEPGQSADCTASYVVTQEDMDAGTVENTATATADLPNGRGTIGSDPDDATVPLPATGELSIVKTANGPIDTNNSGRIDAGDTIDYTFTVENTGAVTMNNITVNDPLVPAISCPSDTLVPGASMECQGTYTLVQKDIDAGSVTNAATASGTDPSGESTESDESRITTPVPTEPSLDVNKSATGVVDTNSSGRIDAGDQIEYSFEVTNTGAVTMTGIRVNDAKVPNVFCPQDGLAPGESMTCTGAYTLTQADIDAGSVNNSATVSGKDPAGKDTESDPSEITTPVPTEPSLGIVKSATGVIDANGSGRIDAGDRIDYAFEVTNTGAVNMTRIQVNDAKVPNVACPQDGLAPGESMTCTGSYTLTQADLDRGSVENSATATGQDPSGNGTESDPSAITTPIPTAPAVTVDKKSTGVVDSNGSGRVDVGDTIEYTFDVANTGSVTVSGIRINDPLIANATCPQDALAPGETMTCTGSYTLTQADMDNGRVANSATASGEDPDGNGTESPRDTEITEIPGQPRMEVVKNSTGVVDSNDSGRIDAGDTINYEFIVTNNGSVTMNGITVNDPKIANVECPQDTLAPGESMTCTGGYTLTQADIDNGRVVNTATVSGTDPNGNGTDSPPSREITEVPTEPGLTLDKSSNGVTDANNNGRVDAGDTIEYTFAVTNNGAVTVNGIAINDALVPNISCPQDSLAPGESMDCTGSYTLTQDDVNTGLVVNTANASGKDPAGNQVTSPDDTEFTHIAKEPSLQVVKTAGEPQDANNSGRLDAGDTIEYTFAVSNNGSVTIRDVAVNDAKLPGIQCPATELAPGESMECQATYTLTQEDIDAGTISNTATAGGTDPDGNSIDSPPSTVETPLPDAPGLTVKKRAGVPVDANGNGQLDAGDTIEYTFEVTNTGTVTMDNIAIQDEKVPGIACEKTSAAPGESFTCAGTYTLTQADIDAGSVTNTATVSGTDPSGTKNTSDPSTVTTPLPNTPGLALVKRAAGVTDANGNGRVDAGDTLRYEFDVTNTGSMTITNLAINDALLEVTCPTTTLEPAASTTCAGDYTLTQADIDAGTVSNTATASGTDPSGNEVTSPPSSITTGLGVGDGAVVVTKRIERVLDHNGDNKLNAGDGIIYAFDVRNDSPRTVTNITVNDAMLDAAGVRVTCESTSVAPGASITCTSGEYRVTKADVDRGSVRNSATVTATTPDDKPITSLPDEVVINTERPSDDLPDTGARIATALLVSLLLIAAGIVITALAKRRRTAE